MFNVTKSTEQLEAKESSFTNCMQVLFSISNQISKACAQDFIDLGEKHNIATFLIKFSLEIQLLSNLTTIEGRS